MAKGIGLNYPLRKDREGYFNKTYDSFTNEKIKLNNLMRTIEGERYMQPSFGLNIYKYLFEPLNDDLTMKIEADIRTKVSYWLPNILLNYINVDGVTERERHRVFIELSFSLKFNPNNYDVVTYTFIGTT